MKRSITFMIMITLMILTFTSVFPKTHALIIGVGDYDDDNLGDLPGAVKDAQQLSQMLIRLGIVEKENLILLTNPGYLDLLIQIEEWVEKGGEADQMIFYFGGHSQEGVNASGKTDTYLLPKDVKTRFLDRSAYNFRQEWQERLSQKLKASETLMIFDTCYAGGITKERGLQDLKLRSLEFEKIAEETNVNFLFSSKENQTSKELEEEHGGWYTYYLLEGIQTGAANYNKDLTIDAEEISRYLEERVSASTKGEQTPISILGKRDMTVSRDENILNDRIKLVILEQTLLKTINRDNSEKYIQILNQKSDQDTPTEAKIRQYLKRYYEDRDVEVLEALTDSVLKDQTPQMEQTDKDLQRQPPLQTEEAEQQPQEPQEQAQRQGTNWLTLIPVNELAIGVKVSINGKQEGTLDKDGLLITNLETGAHTIKIDAETIEEKTIEITFANDWMMVKKEIEAQPAKRKIIIITDPLMASVKLNGQTLKETTPIQLDIQIGQEHTITINKDGYKEKELSVKEDSKGEPKPINIQLEANQAPDTPRLIAPTGTQEDTTTTLKWYGTDPEGDAITYEIYIAEAGQPLEKETETKATTNAENSYTLTNLKPNTSYTWQVIAKDQWQQTQGVIWQFKTRDIITKQIRIETNPSNVAIYINGSHKGSSPLTIELQEGTHTIEARKDGYKTQTTTKTIGTQTKDLSRIETITLTLEKETGSLYIQSTPSGAFIYLNGSYKGTTAKTIENLEPGTYSLKLTKDGYKDKTQNLTIEAGKRESAYITLESAEYQPSAQAPEQVLVKAGTFQMGNTRGDSEGYSNEKPVHTVKLTYDYYIGKYEVTFNEYDAYCEDSGKSKLDDRDWGRGNRPVINVTWTDAIKYCNWLSESEGLSKAYDSEGNLLDKNGRQTTDITQVEGYRLPTEAEWEYAAKGGHKSTTDYKYAGSNSLTNVTWYDENSNSKTHEVGQKSPNELGLYDMSGNVYEWCHDWYDDYTSSTQTNPTGPKNASRRVKRSGSWIDPAEYCRVADRSGGGPNSSSSLLGLRIARTRK